MFLPKKNTIQIVISYTGLATITVSVSNKKKLHEIGKTMNCTVYSFKK
jgi:hypothetical protein